MELLLHYLWKHRLYAAPLQLLEGGQEVELINVGQHNSDAGPDFFNAKLRIDGVVWAGNVEIHIDEDDWYTHGHHLDSSYNNTILHVVQNTGCQRAVTADGKQLPTAVMSIGDKLLANYRHLLSTDDYPRCHSVLPTLDSIKVHGYLEALLVERLQERASLVAQRAEACGNDWEKAFFITLARNFGFGKNGDEFEQWARMLPLQSIAHHRDNLFQVEAMFLGVARLIGTHGDDEHSLRLKSEYEYLAKKFSLPTYPRIAWRFMRMRPQSFPDVRLRQLAALYCNGGISLSAVIANGTVDKLQQLFKCSALSRSSCNLLIINTVVPVLWAYADHQKRQELKQQALDLLYKLPCEENFITRQWRNCGINVSSAAYSQALIQLKRSRCDRNDCLRCRFAYDFLRK